MPKIAIHTPEVPDFRAPTSLAIRSENLLFISGMAAHDREGKTVGVGDADAQTRQALDNLKALLEAAGGTLADVVKLTIFVRNIADRPKVNKVRAEYFREPYPSATLAEVTGLAGADWLVEIEAIAVLGA